MHGYRPVSSSQDSCCLDGQKLCVVACCMMSFLSIGTAAMLHLAPHHVAAGASYVGLDQNAVHGMHRHVNHWAQSSGLDAHLQRAGQWVAGVGHDMHRVGADFADHAGLDQHMQRAGDWAREVHQQLLGQDQILSPYDCTTADIPTWSHAHKEWCCEHQDTACAEASTTASTSPSPQHYMWISVPLHKGKYDCAAGIDNWLKGWSHGKQNWCCQNKGIGCLHEVRTVPTAKQSCTQPQPCPCLPHCLRSSRTMEAATRLRDPHAETPQSLFPQKEFDASQ
eukprot:s3031_g7.t1